MPKWVKVVLIIVVVGFLALVAGVIVAARWVRSQGTNLQEQGKKLAEDALAFGEGKEPEACIAEGLVRLSNCPGFICEAKINVFLAGCLRAANDATELCAGVPPQVEIMATVNWQLEECKRRGWANNQRCTRMLGAVQTHCAQLRE